MNHKLTTITAAGLLAAALAAAPVAEAEDGAAVFKAQCAKCHGETGMADTESGKRLKVPHLAGDEKVAAMTLDEVIASMKANKKHKTFIGKLSEEQISAAGGYAKQLAGK